MSSPADKLAKLFDILSKESVDKAEFLAAFQKVVDLVMKVSKQNSDSRQALETAIGKAKADLESEITKNADLASSKAVSELRPTIETLIAQAEEKFAAVDAQAEKLSNIKAPEPTPPDSAEDIRNKLELLEGDERLDQSAIKGLKEDMAALKDVIGRVADRAGRVISPPNNAVQFADLSSQCDGVTTKFTVPRHRFIVGLQSTQFPNIFRPGVDFTTANTTLSLVTSQVAAPQAGQTLMFLYVK